MPNERLIVLLCSLCHEETKKYGIPCDIWVNVNVSCAVFLETLLLFGNLATESPAPWSLKTGGANRSGEWTDAFVFLSSE